MCRNDTLCVEIRHSVHVHCEINLRQYSWWQIWGMPVTILIQIVLIMRARAWHIIPTIILKDSQLWNFIWVNKPIVSESANVGDFKLWHRYIECCRFRGYETHFLNSFRLKRVSDFIFHYISGVECGPIRANVRWIHYLWPPAFSLFFHRIKPRGGGGSLYQSFTPPLRPRFLAFRPILPFTAIDSNLFQLKWKSKAWIRKYVFSSYEGFKMMQHVWIWQFIITHIENC